MSSINTEGYRYTTPNLIDKITLLQDIFNVVVVKILNYSGLSSSHLSKCRQDIPPAWPIVYSIFTSHYIIAELNYTVAVDFSRRIVH